MNPLAVQPRTQHANGGYQADVLALRPKVMTMEMDVAAEFRRQDARMDEVTQRLAKMEVETGEIKHLMAKNTETIAKIDQNSKEMLEVFNSWKGAMKALEMIGKVAGPLAAIVGLVSAVVGGWFTFFKGGQ